MVTHVKEVRMGKLNAQVLLKTVRVSANGNRIAYAEAVPGGIQVVVDGKHHETFEGISGEDIGFSPDSKTFFYVARNQSDVMVVVDGEAQRPYADIKPNTMTMCPRQGVAYVGLRDAGSFVSIGGQESPKYDNAWRPVFNSDGSRAAYAACQGRDLFVVLNGVKGPVFQLMSTEGLVFSPDGKRCAYAAGRNGKWLVVVDGEEIGDYEGIGKDTLTFSHDGRHFAFVAGRDGHQFVVVDGVESQPFDGVAGRPVFWGNDAKCSCPARLGEKYVLVANGVVTYECDGIYDILVSPNRQRLAMNVRIDDKCAMVLDGVVSRGRWDAIGDRTMTFSPDSSRLAYAGRSEDTWSLVLDETAGQPFAAVSCLTFSPDSQRFAFFGKRDDGIVAVVDDKQSVPYDGFSALGLAFSPDGRHLVCAPGHDGTRMVLVDGQRVNADFNDFLLGSAWVFETDDQFHFVAHRDDDLLRLSVACRGGRPENRRRKDKGTKTLSDSRYSFSLSYPEDWSVEAPQATPNGIMWVFRGGFALNLVVGSLPKHAQIDFESRKQACQYMAKVLCSASGGCWVDDGFESVPGLDPNQAFLYWFLHTSPLVGHFKKASIQTVDTEYVFTGGLGVEPQCARNHEVFDSIVSSLTLRVGRGLLPPAVSRGDRPESTRSTPREQNTPVETTKRCARCDTEVPTGHFECPKCHYGRFVYTQREGKGPGRTGECTNCVETHLAWATRWMADRVVASNDRKRWAAVAEDAGMQYVIVDGIEGPKCEGIVRTSLVFSPDGRHFAYGAKRRTGWAMVLDGVVVAEHSDGLDSAIFSSDSSHCAYMGGERGRYCVVLDGRKGPQWERIGEIVLSPNGHHLAYVAKRGNQSVLTVDHEEVAMHDRIGGLMCTPGGGKLCYVVRDGDKEMVIVGSLQVEAFEGVNLGTVSFSADGVHIAFVSRMRGGEVLVHDGCASKVYESVTAPVFGPAGNKLVYGATKGGRWVLVENGRESPVPGLVGGFAFAKETGSLAYVVGPEGSQCVVVGDHPGKLYEGVGAPTLGPRGDHWAYGACTGGVWCVVKNEVEGRPYDGIGDGTPRLSPEGTHWCYVGIYPDGKGEVVVVDDTEGRRYDGLHPLAGPVFVSSSHVEFYAVRERSLYHVRQGCS